MSDTVVKTEFSKLQCTHNLFIKMSHLFLRIFQIQKKNNEFC